ncbi:MAG: DNA recombination protein RmuC [Deltaproteobacteria bacterium]|nr:MAG: DNA recombination protein RmuC [Deltaproteobacteria bacterium]
MIWVWISIAGAFLIGFALGLGGAYFLRIIQAKTARELADELFRDSEARRKADINTILENVKASFGSLSLEALSKSTEEFLKLAKAKLESEREVSLKELDAKKGLIDQQLQRMNAEMEKISILMNELEKDRVEKFGELSNQLKTATEQTAALVEVTNTLREALASTKARGQWGERMAEDVLRLCGFVEKVNYLKQKAIEGGGVRPDFTFLLPNNLKLNMDVKFPLDNYLRFLEADSETDKVKFRNAFLKDVKARIKEVTTREYINPETVNCVLLFIPNEQIYAFIHEQDSSILENGIKNRVVFCSPITLFAVLAVIRQAVDNFALEQTSNEILSLMGRFKKQWDEFIKKLEILGKRIEEAQKEYGTIMTTRRRQLEKPLTEIETLRTQRGLPVASDEGE